MKRTTLALAAGLLIAAAGTAGAVQPDKVLPDAKLEARARAITSELRCMVCQNESIDDSEAPLARDLRVLVRDRLKAGDTNRQVFDYLVSRYGEFVLLKPRFEARTFILWLTAPVLLVIGLIAALIAWRRSRRESEITHAEDPLTDAEKAEIAKLLGTKPPAPKGEGETMILTREITKNS